MRSIYIIGSMRNPRVPEVAKLLRERGWDAFDDWYSSGPETDDYWQKYERERGRTYIEALNGEHARDVFDFDKRHLDRCSSAVLVAPAGKSAHLELGYTIGCGKPGYILLDAEPDRYDIMARFATGIFMSVSEMFEALEKPHVAKPTQNDGVGDCVLLGVETYRCEVERLKRLVEQQDAQDKHSVRLINDQSNIIDDLRKKTTEQLDLISELQARLQTRRVAPGEL